MPCSIPPSAEFHAKRLLSARRTLIRPPRPIRGWPAARFAEPFFFETRILDYLERFILCLFAFDGDQIATVGRVCHYSQVLDSPAWMQFTLKSAVASCDQNMSRHVSASPTDQLFLAYQPVLSKVRFGEWPLHRNAGIFRPICPLQSLERT